MKTFIVGLFSLVVLASGAAWGHEDPKNKPYKANLPAAQGFCNANKGIFIILVKNDGAAYFYKCRELKGPPNRTITKEKSDLGYPEKLVSYTLGVIQKSRPEGGGTDPCITWAVGGSSYYYCW